MQGQPVPLDIGDTQVLRRQFYYAVALHERRAHLQGLVTRLQSVRNRILANARQGPHFPLPFVTLEKRMCA